MVIGVGTSVSNTWEKSTTLHGKNEPKSTAKPTLNEKPTFSHARLSGNTPKPLFIYTEKIREIVLNC